MNYPLIAIVVGTFFGALAICNLFERSLKRRWARKP